MLGPCANGSPLILWYHYLCIVLRDRIHCSRIFSWSMWWRENIKNISNIVIFSQMNNSYLVCGSNVTTAKLKYYIFKDRQEGSTFTPVWLSSVVYPCWRRERNCHCDPSHTMTWTLPLCRVETSPHPLRYLTLLPVLCCEWLLLDSPDLEALQVVKYCLLLRWSII